MLHVTGRLASLYASSLLALLHGAQLMPGTCHFVIKYVHPDKIVAYKPCKPYGLKSISLQAEGTEIYSLQEAPPG